MSRGPRTLVAALSVVLATTAAGAPKGPVDDWKGVGFDRGRFEQVRRYVRRYYIDGHADEKLGWIGAANGALGRLRPPLELLPAAWYARHRDLPRDRGRLSGPTAPLRCGGATHRALLLHGLPGRERPRRGAPLPRDTDAWSRERREEQARRQALRDAWRRTAFGKREMDCAMSLAMRRLSDKNAGLSLPVASTETSPPPPLPPSLAAPPDPNRLWIAATNGYLHALDPHSAVIAKAAWDRATRRTQDASFEGIGAVMTWEQGCTLVDNPMRGLPAHKAGLRAGDEIVAVDGRPVRGLQLSEVVALIRGPRGTAVRLRVARPGHEGMIEITVLRSRVQMKNVSGELLPSHPGLAVVRMSGFVPQSTLDLRSMILELRRGLPDKTLEGLILDLRGNGGGLLDKAIELADMFLDHGRIVSIRNRDVVASGREEELHEARRQPGWDLDVPLVVLMDDGSASASEILAAALQDNGRALITGLRSFGKGSVQRLFDPPMQGDYYLKLTVARYHAPSGRSIQLGGVVPEVRLPREPGGGIPIGFREENLAGHLAAADPAAAGPLARVVPALDACVKRSGVALRVMERERKAAVRPDFQLLRSADYLRCLARLQHGR